MSKRIIGFSMALGILFVLTSYALFRGDITDKEKLKILSHYLSWKIPPSYTMEPYSWDDESGFGVHVSKKKSSSSQTISLSLVKMESEDFDTLPEIVFVQTQNGGRNLGNVTIHGDLWTRYTTKSHYCAATTHNDFAIWMCLSPEDPEHPSDVISKATFNRILRSIKIKPDVYFIPTTQYTLSRQFSSLYKKLNRCSSLADDDEPACIKETAEKVVKVCKKFKKDCPYLAEQAEHARRLGTDEEELSSTEVFNNIAQSLSSLKDGGPEVEPDE